MDKCNNPHPNNNNPYAATYFSRAGSMSTEMPGMFCQREAGHDGRHACYRAWDSIPGMGEEHQWGGDLDAKATAAETQQSPASE